MYEYKTIVYKEGSINTMSAKNVNPAKFSKVLNHYAQEGWRLKAVEKDSQKAFFGGTREAYLLIMERRVS
jgi:hypothetical protein